MQMVLMLIIVSHSSLIPTKVTLAQCLTIRTEIEDRMLIGNVLCLNDNGEDIK